MVMSTGIVSIDLSHLGWRWPPVALLEWTSSRLRPGRARRRPARGTGAIPDPLAVAGQRLLISVVLGFTIDETGEGGLPPRRGSPTSPRSPTTWARATTTSCSSC